MPICGLVLSVRKLLVLLVMVAALAAIWVFAGKEISVVADQSKTREIESIAVVSVSYEGSGEGGTLVLNNERFTLNSLNPHVGSTKDSQLALAFGGKVLAFGPLRSSENESLTTSVPVEDRASLSKRQSFIPWPTFDAGKLRLNCRNYRELLWTKPTGGKLRMLWALDPNDANSINLIRVEISDATR